jgi:hypothetical protein
MRNESMIRKIPDGKDVADAKKRGLQNCGQQVSEEKKHEKQNEVSISQNWLDSHRTITDRAD